MLWERLGPHLHSSLNSSLPPRGSRVTATSCRQGGVPLTSNTLTSSEEALFMNKHSLYFWEAASAVLGTGISAVNTRDKVHALGS